MNLSTLRTPGVYIEEVSLFPPSVAGVETGIPAFVGYAERTQTPAGKNLELVPTRITSLLEYRELFGGPKAESKEGAIEVKIYDLVDKIGAEASLINREIQARILPDERTKFNLFYAVQWYFANGGGPCYIVAVDTYGNAPAKAKLEAGVNALETEDEPTMIVVPESISLGINDQVAVYETALAQAKKLGDRVVIMDVIQGGNGVLEDMKNFRDEYEENRMFGAAYYPYIRTSLDFEYDNTAIAIVHDVKDNEGNTGKGGYNGDYGKLKNEDKVLHEEVKKQIGNIEHIMPPSPAIAGVYAKTDAERGVWKAPANVGLARSIGPDIRINDDAQAGMNVDPGSGKSVNAIRHLTGRGTVVWGARTLMGESNEWRYINVRRFFNFVEESVKKATYRFVFEPNDANTWVSVRAMIENFLTLQWRAGALQGAKPEHAFFVRVGLGQTMTADDILNGRLIVEIGMAVVRPAEFIVLRFMHKLPES